MDVCQNSQQGAAEMKAIVQMWREFCGMVFNSKLIYNLL